MSIKFSSIRRVCGVKLIENRDGQELMDLLGLEETLDLLARSSNVRNGTD